jgi:hypothetical protein
MENTRTKIKTSEHKALGFYKRAAFYTCSTCVANRTFSGSTLKDERRDGADSLESLYQEMVAHAAAHQGNN